jgi:sulfate/thiosulfate transport system substrate-binding protein
MSISTPSWHVRRRSRVRLLVVVLVAVFGASACGGGSTDEPGGADISSGRYQVKLIAYAVPKVGFDDIIPAFRGTAEGAEIGFSQSYGASGDQSRKVARHVPADVVNFSVEPDITRLVREGLVDEDWKKRYPNNSTPFGSVVSLVVREGNPKGIHDWDDLLRPGVEVITPNPSSSGSAKWNLLAPFAVKSDGGRHTDAGLAYIQELVRDHIVVNPKSGREATAAFQQGQGDVLISYENEAIFLDRQNATVPASQRIEYVTPSRTFKIENPVAVVNTSEVRPQADQFVAFLFSTEGQQLWAEAGFRPVVPDVVAATANLFPGEIDTLDTIADLGGVVGKGAGTGGADLSRERPGPPRSAVRPARRRLAIPVAQGSASAS